MRCLQDSRLIFCFHVLLAIAVSAQKYVLDKVEYDKKTLRHYNNYLIFKYSAKHLLEGKNLYTSYPDEHDDLYKYSPTFAVLMLPFWYLPDAIGLCLWNLCNAIPLFLAIWLLPMPQEKRALIAWLILPELLINMQNSQSNGLVAACMIMTFVAIERRKWEITALPIALSAFIKIFGVLSSILAVFSKNRYKVMIFGAVWFALWLSLPLLVVPPSNLIAQYENWLTLLKEDYEPLRSASVYGCWLAWFENEPPRMWLTLIGVAALLLPLTQIKKYENLNFRITYLGFLMIWGVIFNHRAESPTFIIAICGVMLWFFAHEKTLLNVVLLALALFCTAILPSDLVPKSWTEYGWKYELKALSCILVWLKVCYDLIFKSAQREESARYVSTLSCRTK